MSQYIECEREKNQILHKRAHPSEFENPYDDIPNGVTSGNGMALRKRARIPVNT